MIYLSVVPPILISPLWPKASPFIHDALMVGNGEYAVGDIREFVDKGTMTLWVLIDETGDVKGAGITELIQYPRKRVANVLLFAADPGLRDTWLPKLEEVERWAYEMGCSTLRVPGRLGWKTVLRDFRTSHVVLTKELEDDAKFLALSG